MSTPTPDIEGRDLSTARDASYNPRLPRPSKPIGGPVFPDFHSLASHLCGYHSPKDVDTAHQLGYIRDAFQELIDTVDSAIPEGPDATLAARAIHDACQRCIAAVILNQPPDA